MGNSVIDFAWLYSHVDADKQISAGSCDLHSVVVNGLTTAGDLTIYDSLTETGTVIAVLHLDPTTSISVQPITFLYDVRCETGLYMGFDQALVADLTVSYR